MLRTPTRWLFLGLLLATTTFSSTAKVRVEISDLTGESHYATYSLEEGTPAQRDRARERIAEAVERELKAKGMLRVFGEGEARVVTHVLVDRHALADLSRDDYWEYWTGINSVDAFDLEAGTLVIDVIDTRENRRVWRGAVSSDVGGSAEKNLKRIDKIVGKLLREYGSR